MSIGFNKFENPSEFKPVSLAVRVHKLYKNSIDVKEHEKKITICPNYIGGPLTYYNSTTKLTSLIGVGIVQTPFFYQCDNNTSKTVKTKYQLLDKVVGWVKEQIGNDRQ